MTVCGRSLLVAWTSNGNELRATFRWKKCRDSETKFNKLDKSTRKEKVAQGLNISFASHLRKLAAPFKQSEEKVGCFIASREDLVSWVQSKSTAAATAT